MQFKTGDRLFLTLGRICGKGAICKLVNDHIAAHGSISADDIIKIIKKVTQRRIK